MHKIKFYFLKAIKKIDSFIRYQSKASEGQLIVFGITLAINNPLFYFIWLTSLDKSYENILLRLSVSFFCVLLIVKDVWPKKLKKLLPYYWYFTVWYGLPLFFTFMTLKNNASTLWLMNCVSVIFFLLLIFDILSVIFLLISGSLCGWLLYSLTESSAFIYNAGQVDFVGISATFLAALFIGAIFSHNKHLIEEQKVKTIEMLGALIAHELRTPLASITNGVSGIKRYFPAYLKTYQIAKSQNLNVPEIRHDHHTKLLNIVDDIIAETSYADTVINMLLVKVKQIDVESTTFEIIAMNTCISEAINRYPFGSNTQKMLINLDKNSFNFVGNKVLMIHVLFNLIKNSLYYIEMAGKGEIYIWMDSDSKFNNLHFKDTGKGIPANIMNKLFTRFFTTSEKGTGLGLSFSRMVMNSFGGNITCLSQQDEYAEFILKFPKIKD